MRLAEDNEAVLAEYAAVGAEAIGDELPMPTRPPEDLGTLTDTYQNWLADPSRLVPLTWRLISAIPS